MPIYKKGSNQPENVKRVRARQKGRKMQEDDSDWYGRKPSNTTRWSKGGAENSWTRYRNQKRKGRRK